MANCILNTAKIDSEKSLHEICGKCVENTMKLSITKGTLDNITGVIIAFRSFHYKENFINLPRGSFDSISKNSGENLLRKSQHIGIFREKYAISRAKIPDKLVFRTKSREKTKVSLEKIISDKLESRSNSLGRTLRQNLPKRNIISLLPSLGNTTLKPMENQ